MQLSRLSLQHFRNYAKTSFLFDHEITAVIGPNTAGKTNFLEAIYLMATGKSFRAEKDVQMIQFARQVAHVKAQLADETTLEVVIAHQTAEEAKQTYTKRYLVNSVPRRRVDFAGHLYAMLFLPSDLDIISGSPSLRRQFLDEVLDVTDREYRIAASAYQRALRQRNALLDLARESGRRHEEQFSYWDGVLIRNGQLITEKRQGLIDYCNTTMQSVITCRITYDHSVISEERLLQYRMQEAAAGVTLVGPHRDDFSVAIKQREGKEYIDARSFGSRGQQRLVVLQLKMLQFSFMEGQIGERPLLLLDDIFSELDANHIQLVLDLIKKQQTILTTTHKEFIGKKLPGMKIIELGN